MTTMFDGVSFLLDLARKNRTAADEGFMVSLCTDLYQIEPMLDNFQTEDRFLLVMNNVDGSMTGGHPGWFNRRVYTVAIIARHQWDDQTDRQKQLNLCRAIFRQFLTRLIAERDNYEYRGDDEVIYMRTDDIQYREMEPYAMAGATGVVFTLRIDEPTDLTYHKEYWSDGQ